MECNTYMYILYYVLYAGIGFWSLNKLVIVDTTVAPVLYIVGQ